MRYRVENQVLLSCLQIILHWQLRWMLEVFIGEPYPPDLCAVFFEACVVDRLGGLQDLVALAGGEDGWKQQHRPLVLPLGLWSTALGAQMISPTRTVRQLTLRIFRLLAWGKFREVVSECSSYAFQPFAALRSCRSTSPSFPSFPGSSSSRNSPR